MSFIQNFTAGATIVFARLQTKLFWQNLAKVAIPFFVIVTLISLLMNSWREIFVGNFSAVAETNFNNGKWENFFGFKLFFSAFYALYVTNKKMK